MSDEAKNTPQGTAETPDTPARKRPDGRPETPPTPFDHPLFLPVLLLAGMLWFGYDGFINQDPKMLEHQDFNRYGFVALTLATLYFGFKGVKEFREDREAAASLEQGEEPPGTGPGSIG